MRSLLAMSSLPARTPQRSQNAVLQTVKLDRHPQIVNGVWGPFVRARESAGERLISMVHAPHLVDVKRFSSCCNYIQ